MEIKQKCEALKTKLKGVSWSELIYRLVLSWFMVSIFYMANTDLRFTDFAYFSEIKLYVLVITVLVVWVLLCMIKNKRFILWLMLISTLLYALISAIGKSSFGFAVGLCAACGVVLVFTDIGQLKLPTHRSVPWIFAVVMIGLMTAFIGYLCCLYYLNHWTPCYDFGLFAQMFHNMKETGLPLITCERDTLLSHFAVHFSPVFYLILPFYMLLPDPCTLLVIQGLVVASGIIPLLLICKRHSLSNHACCLFSLIYALYPCFTGGCFYYLHENNFLAPLILWFVYFSEKQKLVPQLIFLALTLCVKEDAVLYTVMAALYFMVSQKKFKRYILMIAISVIYFIVVTYILSHYGDGVMTGRYDNYIYDESGSLLTAVKAVIKNPIYVLTQCFTEKKLIFILKMLLPLAFMPIMTKKASRYILIVPFLLINLMTSYSYQFDIGFHYCFGSGCLLIYLAVLNYADLKKPKLLLYSAFCSLIIFTAIYSPRNEYLKAYDSQQTERETIDRAFSLIPDDASVACSTFFVANLSEHSELYQLETTKQTAEYYAIDLRYTTDEIHIDDYLNDSFETVFFENNIVAVFRRK